MNKIIIVGHPFSGYLDVEARLKKSGVAAAQPSQHEGITAVEIGSVLSRAHGVTPVGELRLDERISQVSVGTVWNGMALDLLRGNLDHSLWCWSDPQAIHFLDYWKQLDPSLMFILLYNHPRSVLSQDPNGAYGLTSEDLEQRVHQWHAYNEALLHFYYRNRDRSLLLHAQPASLTGDQQILQLLSSMEQLKTSRFNPLLLPQSGPTALNSQGLQYQNLPVVHRYWIDHFSADRENHLKQFLAGELIGEMHQSLQLYEELQAVANLPEEGSQHEMAGNALAAWRVFADLYKQSQVLGEQSLEKQQYIDVLEHEQQLLNTQIGEKDSLLKRTEKSSTQLKDENGLLLQQLHQVQEELERYFLESRKKEKELEGTKEESSKPLKDENDLLLQQLHQVQEELERYFLENRELKNQQKPAYYGAAERLKGDLPYQLGSAIIERSRKLWPLPFLPISMWRISCRHRKHIKETEENLPPLVDYRDYHEAEKAQKHLSYRLGMAWLRHIRTPWGCLYMPFALFGAHRAYLRYRKEQGK